GPADRRPPRPGPLPLAGPALRVSLPHHRRRPPGTPARQPHQALARRHQRRTPRRRERPPPNPVDRPPLRPRLHLLPRRRAAVGLTGRPPAVSEEDGGSRRRRLPDIP